MAKLKEGSVFAEGAADTSQVGSDGASGSLARRGTLGSIRCRVGEAARASAECCLRSLNKTKGDSVKVGVEMIAVQLGRPSP